MKRVLMIFLVLALVLPNSVFANFQPENYKYLKQISSPDNGFVIVELDSEVMEKTKESYEDIRLSGTDGKELSFQLLPPGRSKEESTITANLWDNVVRENEYSRVTLDLQKNGILFNRLNLNVIFDRDFLREVTLEGSDDNYTWHLVGKDRIFSVEPGIRDTEILYPNTSYRYLRVTIDSKGEKPLTISGARVGFIPVEPHLLTQVQGKITSLEQVKGNTEITLDLGVKGYRIEKLLLDISGQNYNRQAEVLDSNNGKDWKVVGGSQIYHYKWTGYEAAEKELSLGFIAGRYIKVIIFNHNSPALGLKGVDIWGGYPQLLVELKPGVSSLYYGNPGAKGQEYDLAGFSHFVNKDNLKVLKLGPEQVNQAYSPAAQPWTERNPWLLNGVIIGVALVLGVIILKSMKKAS